MIVPERGDVDLLPGPDVDRLHAELEDRSERLNSALQIQRSAEKSYRQHPDNDHLRDLQAATKLVRETRALLTEWTR